MCNGGCDTTVVVGGGGSVFRGFLPCSQHGVQEKTVRVQGATQLSFLVGCSHSLTPRVAFPFGADVDLFFGGAETVTCMGFGNLGYKKPK